MDRSNSTASNSSSGSRPGSTAPFGYQLRLLERNSSRSGSNTLSRSSSQSSVSILTNTTGSSNGTPPPRRWTSHRVTNSLDTVRGKWEELAKESYLEATQPRSASPTKGTTPSRPLSTILPSTEFETHSASALQDRFSPPGFPSSTEQVTPKALKRRTMPAPIIASPLSPNTTGVSVEADSALSSTPHRIRIPNDSLYNRPSWKASEVPVTTPPKDDRTVPVSNAPLYRSRTLDVASKFDAPTPSTPPARSEALRSPVKADRSLFERPSSSSGHSDFSRFRSLSKTSSSPVLHDIAPTSPTRSPPPPASPPSVMFPAPYRSSHTPSRKADTYSNTLSAGGARRRLGNHLPRIASGDGDDSWSSEHKRSREKEEPIPEATRSPRERNTFAEQDAQQLAQSKIGTVEGVSGLPGRLQLKAPAEHATPTPAKRYYGGGSWADKQRHLLQAYEYLCHVGEAQQWIEGCLGEELEFGVVELEEGLRNGVILAKLVRSFKGESFVKRIHEAPKLDYRHSDNINIFFRFLEEVGLPESFVFELTDLYNKKNLPKVIYCVHALSHLLARRGMAQRIGNLLGQLEFSDDQLRQAQKGLKDAGVALPNFGNVGRELAKEINEPEPEETEDERRDRMLHEAQDSIVALQAHLYGFLKRKEYQTKRGRLGLTERHVRKFQAHLTGALVRRGIRNERREIASLAPWVRALQATCRGALARRAFQAKLNRLINNEHYIVLIQAQLRGILQRQRYSRLKASLRRFQMQTRRLQSAARGHLVRHTQQELKKSFAITFAAVGLQAHCRGFLLRRRLAKHVKALRRAEPSVGKLQSHCRGLLMRRRMRNQLTKLENATHVIVRIQAAARTFLARKRLLALIRGLRQATSGVIALQAHARGKLAQEKHRRLVNALRSMKTIKTFGKLQAIAKASLVRKEHQQLEKKLKVTLPDVRGFQAAARGALLRREYRAWRDHLHRSQPVASVLQAMLRGVMVRRSFRAKMDYYRANLNKVVKIQSLFRAKETREQYRQLTVGKNVTVSTIKNFVHLLDDSEADFQEEVKVQRLRKKVVEQIRENQTLENEVVDLDTKIALALQNMKSFEEVLKARKRSGADNTVSLADRNNLLAAHNDPFSSHNIDQEARRKRELYQQLFFLLQTHPVYLARLLLRASRDEISEANRQFIERATMVLFGYGQGHREEYLLLKYFQVTISEELATATAIEDVVAAHPAYINVALHYIRPRHVTYIREAFQSIILELCNADDVDLESDPSTIHQALVEMEEMRSNRPSTTRKDLSFREALDVPATRAKYIQHLQLLQWWTEAFMKAIILSLKKMPYNMRYLIRETLICLQLKFPDAPREAHALCVGKLIYYHYINPAFATPEVFDIIPKGTNMATGKKNLAQISTVFSQIVTGVEFDDSKPSLIPINDFVLTAVQQISAWFMEVANIPDAETQFHAHEFLDATAPPKPIYISPNEIYTVHTLLQQNQTHLSSRPDDTLRVILAELGGVPHLDNEELREAREITVTLELTNRFAHIQDARAEEKTLWVQAKRGVLAILRVQPAQDLFESLMKEVTPDDELRWGEILDTEIENELRQIPRRQPSAAAGDSAYRLEDIRTLTFASVKLSAVKNLLALESQGRISRNDGFQGILDAIAGDVRSKHRKRLQRQKEISEMNAVLVQLAQRKKYFEEQIENYHVYVESAMQTMQKGKSKKRFVLPFTKQWSHLRDLQRTGQAPQFGSFIYSGKELYDRGILISVENYSPRQFNKFQLTISSDRAGIFSLLLESNMLGIPSRVANEDIRMEDLLQAKYEKKSSYSLFGGKVKVNFELFLFQINKKFYA